MTVRLTISSRTSPQDMAPVSAKSVRRSFNIESHIRWEEAVPDGGQTYGKAKALHCSSLVDYSVHISEVHALLLAVGG